MPAHKGAAKRVKERSLYPMIPSRASLPEHSNPRKKQKSRDRMGKLLHLTPEPFDGNSPVEGRENTGNRGRPRVLESECPQKEFWGGGSFFWKKVVQDIGERRMGSAKGVTHRTPDSQGGKTWGKTPRGEVIRD